MQKDKGTFQIFTLGRFVVKRGEQELTEERQRAGKRWRLFQLLLAYRGQVVPQETAYTYLDLKENVNPSEALKALVYYLRQALKEKGPEEPDRQHIVNCTGGYFFNQKVDYYLDAEEFEMLCKKAERQAKNAATEAIKTYRKALVLYKGDYLVEAGFAGWVLSARSHYRELYLRSILEANRLLRESGQYETAWELCESALKIIPLDDNLYQLSIQSLLDAGKKSLARIQHEEAVALFKEGGLEVPVGLQEMDKLFEKSEYPEEDPSRILEELRARRVEDGAFECRLQTFTAIYELEKGRSERKSGSHVYLVHLRVAGEDSPEKVRQACRILGEVLRNTLRKGDVICQWSQRHFLLLLENVTTDQVVQIVARSKGEFRARFKNCGLTVESRFRMV